MRKCRACGQEKAVEEFSRGHARCKPCVNEWQRERRRANPNWGKSPTRQIEPTKVCTQCGVEKEIDLFRRGQGYRGGIVSACKACEAERLKRWRQEHPEQVQAQWKRSNDSRKVRKIGHYDPDPQVRDLVKLRVRTAYLLRKYGITLDDELRLLEAQGYLCAACGDSIADGHHIDHCHIGGFVRALLCGRCNVVLGSAEESPEILRKIAVYAETHNRPNPLLTDK